MNDIQITASHLTKTYRIPQREAGLRAAFHGLFHPTYHTVEAVRDIEFAVRAGEMIGFIGPNGAGKTTTLKMLSGLLYPSSGAARVAGFVPWERKPDFLRLISMVMGNKGQLAWENTVMDSLAVLGEIYRVPPADFKRTLDELIALLELEPLLGNMARNLSLGERMKCELAAALLYRPRVVFLDEPTLGLDVTMQIKLRRFIAEYNRRSGATVMLTSHYMADVVSLCSRVILIHRGRLLFDGDLSKLAAQMAPFKLIRMTAANGDDGAVEKIIAGLGESAALIGQENRTYTLRVANAEASRVTAGLLNELLPADITVEDPPIEAVIDQVYREGVAI